MEQAKDIEAIINTPKGQGILILKGDIKDTPKVWEVYTTNNKKVGEIETSYPHEVNCVKCVAELLAHA